MFTQSSKLVSMKNIGIISFNSLPIFHITVVSEDLDIDRVYEIDTKQRVSHARAVWQQAYEPSLYARVVWQQADEPSSHTRAVWQQVCEQSSHARAVWQQAEKVFTRQSSVAADL